MRNSFPVLFSGELTASKSVMNRLLIAQSFFPALQIKGSSQAADVLHLQQALADFAHGKNQLDCGEAGTVFRFLALRVSRMPGSYLLKGTSRLLQRPQTELISILNQLGVDASLDSSGLHIRSKGWEIPPQGLRVDQSQSSQFASGIFLSGWDLPQPLIILSERGVSEGYLQLTIQSLQKLGMRIEASENGWKIFEKQQLRTKSVVAECDLSSAAALACAGILAGDVEIKNFPFESLQPDLVFVEFLKRMGAQVLQEGTSFRFRLTEKLKSLTADFSDCPDLVPVMAVLCGFAEGVSKFSGAKQLKHKESDRLEKTKELLSKSGFRVQFEQEALLITGLGKNVTPRSFVFDPDQDHRMAMAAGLLMTQGFSIELLTPFVVKKSYPEFWDHLGMTV